MRACGVCRTDLHIVDGELREPKLPLVPATRSSARRGAGEETSASRGDRVGVPWLGWACGECRFCARAREPLPSGTLHRLHRDGGYAELAAADERFCLPSPTDYEDRRWRRCCRRADRLPTLPLTGDAERLGLYGFGASAHLVCQVAVHQGRRVFAFTRAGDDAGQGCARSSAPNGRNHRRAARGARCGDHLRPGRRADPEALRASRPAASSSAQDPHERHPLVALRDPLGRARAALGRQPHPRDGEEFLALAPRIRAYPGQEYPCGRKYGVDDLAADRTKVRPYSGKKTRAMRKKMNEVNARRNDKNLRNSRRSSGVVPPGARRVPA